MDMKATVHRVLAEQLAVSEDKLCEDTKLVDDLGADSLDVVEIIMALEDEFTIEIPDDEAETGLNTESTVGSVVEFVRGKLDAKEG